MLTEPREAAIRAAYSKLDPEQISKVTLDDLAKHYNVTGARDVANGQCSEEQHYHTFLELWQMAPTDQVTYDQFLFFFDNVSSAYETDDEFCAMMKTCFGL